MPTATPHRPATSPSLPSSIPPTFTHRKSRILATLSQPASSYTDKSPKGSVDAPIADLIAQINAVDGLVTTSSCSGRVAVFVEGLGKVGGVRGGDDGDGDTRGGVSGGGDKGGPAGKGGGRWLYVSHEPVPLPPPPSSSPSSYFLELCGLSLPSETSSSSTTPNQPTTATTPAHLPRLVKLLFSPLILHVQCATLSHAQPLLAAAINAGFRESGVQSLRVLDDPGQPVTVGIRTAGLGFESVVGVVVVEDSESENRGEEEEEAKGGKGVCYRALVDEPTLEMLIRVVNERFEWNERRAGRLRGEIARVFEGKRKEEWEDKEVRRRRLREEGLRHQQQQQQQQQQKQERWRREEGQRQREDEGEEEDSWGLGDVEGLALEDEEIMSGNGGGGGDGVR